MVEDPETNPSVTEAERHEVRSEGHPVPDPLPPEGPISAEEQRRRLVRAGQVIWFLTGLLEALIGLRVLMKLLAANPNAPFARFVYGITDVFLAPFFGLLATPSADGMVLELPAIFGMVVYALLAWAIVRAMWLMLSPH